MFSLARGFALLCVIGALVVSAARAHAQSSAPPGTPVSGAVRKLNPLAAYMEIAATLAVGASAARGEDDLLALEFEPRLPFTLTRDWRLIARSNIPFARIRGSHLQLGDIVTSMFVTQAQASEWVWGAGPVVQAPTAADGAGR